MTAKPLDGADLEAALIELGRAGTGPKAARALGIPAATHTSRLREARRRLAVAEGEPAEVARLKAAAAAARREASDAQEAALTAAETRRLMDELVGPARSGIAPWVGKKPARSRPAIWSLFLSDLHYGELVDAGQMGGVNAYNRAIARRRIEAAFDLTVDLAKNHSANDAAGIVVKLGGDLINGVIHSELKEGAAPVTHDILDVFELLRSGLTYLADEFGAVQVFSVVGNHGRLDAREYGRSKLRQDHNFEWLLVEFLARSLATDSRITFEAAVGNYIIFDVFDSAVLLMHGDEARGGNGWTILNPIRKVIQRVKAAEAASGQRIDYTFMGHWHQLHAAVDMIINGSAKGYDEYARRGGFEPQVPAQALMAFHPTLGMTEMRPLWLDGTAKLVRGKDTRWFEGKR